MNANRTRVAVVDDDESFSRAIARLLRAAGFEPSVYSSAEAFLQDGTEASADCIVLDIHLEGMSGFDLRRRLTARGQTTPVVFVTAHDDPEAREEAQQVGGSAYLCKPVPKRVLLEAIARAVNPASHRCVE
jgi:FixJ family two-component response regulator